MILLDTCAIIWDALAPDQLSPAAKSAIDQADMHEQLAIADISFWEIAMLINKGRLHTAEPSSYLLNLFLQSRAVAVKALSPEIAEMSVSFDETMNKDPADRIIAATAIVHNARLVTADQNLLRHPMIDTVW
ncbi:PIN domain-containing protein [Seongchinamella sediminis]|uniref:PIN domain-containing protein n=1 Tax=Seongchinamella sediminis TaxID=2283635 RepID=A0A3L7DWN7_9GAMM|nr:type II toxin-antitoxin system VapC family toxin [Seongchinamella sediminis]RLQ21195.1 PIN domain-containing protein [Seongchinamella sediminis]